MDSILSVFFFLLMISINFALIYIVHILHVKLIHLSFWRTRELLELGIDNEDSEHENDDDTNQS